MDWVVLSSGVWAIAQADVTKYAREIPNTRRIGNCIDPSCGASPSPRATGLAVPYQ
jgi:hypothetical protein